MTGEQPWKGFFWVRQSVTREHTNLTLSLVCALSQLARVSVFLGPKQLFPSKQQTAHISASTGGFNDGEEEGLERGEWDLTVAGKYCPRTPELAPQPTFPSLPLPRLLLYEFICAHWFLRGSPLARFDWVSLRAVARAESLIWLRAIAYF